MKEIRGSAFGVKELAKYLDIAEITVYRLSEKGKIPGRKVGAQWRYVKDQIDQWLRERE